MRGCSRRSLLVLLLVFCLGPVQREVVSQVSPLVADSLVATGEILTEQKIVASLPAARNKARGYTIDIVADGSGNAGYLPVQIRVKSTSTFSADRNVLVRFQPVELGQSPPQNGITCDVPLLAPQGAKDVKVIRQLPKWSVGTAFKIRVFEDGVELEDYEREVGTLLQRNRQAPTEYLSGELGLNWLHIVDGQADEMASLSALEHETHRENNKTPQNSTARSIRQRDYSRARQVIRTVAPANVSSDWRQLQSFDGVLVAANTLAELAQQFPGKFQALRDWIMAGGTIVVLGSESPEQTLASLDFKYRQEYLEGIRVQRSTRAAIDDLGKLRGELINERARVQSMLSSGRTGPAWQTTSIQLKDQLKEIAQHLDALANRPQVRDRIWAHSALAGQVMGMTGDEQITHSEWNVVIKFFGYRKSPTLRRGVDPILGDQRVNRWMIPGVAQPPVYTFIGLLTVFVILVGPIAYRRTTKIGRSYLMFGIAPILALVTTVAMFTYGVVADGFGTVTRIRQLTWIDGQSGDGFERVRATYFAGMRPAEGLQFAADAEVVNYPDYDGLSWEELNGRQFTIAGRVLVNDDGQKFDNSFLPSRTQRQFVVHQPRHQIGKLSLNPPASGGATDPPTMNNQFEFELRNVVARDASGAYWVADKLDAGQADGSCELLSSNSASKVIGDLYNSNRPLAELRRSRRYSSYDRRIRDLIIALNRSLGDTEKVITDGIFETQLQRKMQVDTELPRGWFVAEADVSQDVISVQGAELVESTRYLFGTLP